jgi:hypothetical protein
MTKDEIYLNNFTESLKLSQKIFNLGLLLTFLAIFVAFNPSDAAGQTKLPYLDIPIKSKESFVIITAFFFLLVGFYMNFAIERCCTTLQLIEDKWLAEAVKGYPSIVNASFPYLVVMVIALSGAWAAAIATTFKIEIIYSVLVSQGVITPYIYGSKKRKKITYQNG